MDNYGVLIIPAVFLVWAGWWVLKQLWTKQHVGEIELSNGRRYTYLIGDYMRSYERGGTFHGVDVSLTKEMPHIYLDSLRKGGRRAQYDFDSSQYVQLEGNFNQDYRVFVPEKYRVLALSILTPDVMATLQDFATDFDVEIYGSHVRIISNKRVLPRTVLQASAVHVAKIVMKEVDHRLQSWAKPDSLDAINQELHMYPISGVRLFGRSFRPAYLMWAVFWFFVTSIFAIFGAWLLIFTDYKKEGVALLSIFAVLFLAAMWMVRRGYKKTRFGSRH